MKFEKYLTEKSLSNSDKRKLSDVLKNKKGTTLNLDYLDNKVKVVKSGKELELEYYDDVQVGKITAELVDLCDELRYDFEIVREEKRNNQIKMIFLIYM